MNDDFLSSASASASASGTSNVSHHERRHDVPLTAAELAERRKKNRQMFNRKRGDLLDDLLSALDTLVYAELSIIYYMDCSFLRLLIRGLVQVVLLTPKPPFFPPQPTNTPYIGAILGSSALCMLLHVVTAAPSAGEETRGYLHGGIAMDFIGQKGPTSKLHLLLLDLLVTALQLVNLAAHITRQRLKMSDSASITVTTSAGRQYNPIPTNQDLDHEERGVRRSAEHEDVEMQNLNASGRASAPTADEGEHTSEQDALLSSTTAPAAASRTDAHIFDAFNSGQIVLADLDIAKTVQEQFWAYRLAIPGEHSADPITTGREWGANITAQMLRWRFGGAATGGRGG